MRALAKLMVLSLGLVVGAVACGDDDGGPDGSMPDSQMNPDAGPDAGVENCNNGIDDDGDGDVDCADSNCAVDPACAGCDPQVVTAPSVVTGNTSGAGDDSSGTCQAAGGGGAEDLVYQLTNEGGARRLLDLVLTSDADLGLYVQTACGDTDAELECEDRAFGGSDETLTVALDPGATVYIWVDGYSSTDAGAFSLDIALQAIPPESNCTNLLDDDFDGLVDCTDPDCVALGGCMAGASATGLPCDMNSDCSADMMDPACFSEMDYGFPSGYCSEYCTLSTGAGCGSPGAICVDAAIGPDTGACLDSCVTVADCPTAGYQCADLGLAGGVLACFPGCTNNSQCPFWGFCDLTFGRCRQPENCTNGVDDTANGYVDCEDEDCEANPVCGIAALCTGAIPLVGTMSGDTTAGTTSFAGTCVGAGLARENLYTMTPGMVGQNGTLTVTLTTTANLGVYVRTTCGDFDSEAGCDSDGVAGNETLFVPVVGGTPVTIYVDGHTPASVGAYTISATFSADVCGDGAPTGVEACDDGNLTNGDGCSSTCQVEFAFYCSMATPGAIGATISGTTVGGTNVFASNLTPPFETFYCTGNGLEKLYTITPGMVGQTGTLQATLSSATDQGLYLRSSCADSSSLMACNDDFPGGMDETLMLTGVAGGAPLTLFVDGFSAGEEGPFTLTVTYTPM